MVNLTTTLSFVNISRVGESCFGGRSSMCLVEASVSFVEVEVIRIWMGSTLLFESWMTWKGIIGSWSKISCDGRIWITWSWLFLGTSTWFFG